LSFRKEGQTRLMLMNLETILAAYNRT